MMNSNELFINVTPNEIRLALFEAGTLQEMYLDSAQGFGIVGNIYCGKVSRVLPGMQAAFIDIGLERAAFLHAADIQPLDNESQISKMVQEGQRIIVQVMKDPFGTKGARLTTRLSLASRYLVFAPDMDEVAVSVRIQDEAERARLKAAIGPLQEKGGYIVRTVAEGVSNTEIEQDKQYLSHVWLILQKKIKAACCGALLYEALRLGLRVLQDCVSRGTKRVLVDDKEFYERAVAFSKTFFPDLVHIFHYYAEKLPLFTRYEVESAFCAALSPTVPLASGGTVVFDQTEAMTTVDVNTGAFVGISDLDETIFKTNKEAAEVIAQQLRLRNIGGIIIIDFIDMMHKTHQEVVLEAFLKALARDPAKKAVGGFSVFGLVEMTRKRTRASLQTLLFQECPVCLGRGAIKSLQTLCNELFREIIRYARSYRSKAFLILSSPPMIKACVEEAGSALAALEAQLGITLSFQREETYAREQFDVVCL